MFDETVYQELRSGLGADLPQDYLTFLRGYSGEEPDPASFWVVEDDWGSAVEGFYVMERGDDVPSLLMALDWDGLPLKPGMIPIGGDGSFGYILLSLRPEDHGSIHFCTTWTDDGVTDHYESQGYWKIADSFTEFTGRLGELPEDD